VRSLRSLNLLLIALVPAPVGVLAALSLNATAGYRAEVEARMRRELDEMEGTLLALARTLVEEDAADAQRRAQKAADLLARRLPFEPPHVVLAAARGEPMPLPPDRAPSNLRVRVVDASGRTVLPARFDPDAGSNAGSDRDRLLEELRHQADAALFAAGDLAAAQRVWIDARARFQDDGLRALADVEQAWLAARASPDPTSARAALDALQRTWPKEVLDGVGRTWVLLALAVSSAGTEVQARHVGSDGKSDDKTWTDEERARWAVSEAGTEVLARLRSQGTLETIPLTDEEREQVAWAWRGQPVPPRGVVPYDVWTAPLPAGLTLEMRRQWPDERDRADMLIYAVRQRWPATRMSPQLVVPHKWRVAALPYHVRKIDLPLQIGGSWPVLVVHPEAGRLSDLIATRKRWTIAGVATLLVLVVVGLYMSTRALAREREATRLKDDFLANVSHELRTPLTAVCLHADLLGEPDLAEGRRRAHAEVVRAEGARLAAMVDDLLDFAALERGSRRLEIEPVDLRAAVAHAVDPFRVLAEREGVDLRVEAASDEATALADPHALARVLANLVGNAWKHGRPSRDGAPGRIRLEVSGGRGGARVTVKDDGPGIPASERARLFERFQRGAAAAKTRGVGLGLALSRDLARAMGGNLVVVEDPEATVFRLTLPPVPPETPT
jgi:signal transduction histidine kinase